MISFKAINDRVVVRRFNRPVEMVGSLYIPDASKEQPTEGVIVAAGPGKYWRGQRCALMVKPGDHVLFGKYTGSEVKLDGVDYVIMREEDLLCVFLPLTSRLQQGAADEFPVKFEHDHIGERH